MYKILKNTIVATCIAIITLNTTSCFANSHLQEIKTEQVKEFFSDQKTAKIVFLFTSWCKHCKIGYLKLQEIAKEYDSSKLTVVAISLDEDKEELYKFYKAYNKDIANIKLYHAAEPKKLIHDLEMYKLNYKGSIPHVAVFKKNGKIIVDGHFNGEYLAALVDALINP